MHVTAMGSCEVFLVDNNSVDGSCEMVAEKFPEVRLIANRENTGFSKANNQAMRISKGEYVLLLNPRYDRGKRHLRKHRGVYGRTFRMPAAWA